jgi:hypothetical protein
VNIIDMLQYKKIREKMAYMASMEEGSWRREGKSPCSKATGGGKGWWRTIAVATV